VVSSEAEQKNPPSSRQDNIKIGIPFGIFSLITVSAQVWRDTFYKYQIVSAFMIFEEIEIPALGIAWQEEDLM
jgi:hypothetical protein